ncbi:MAG: NHL repeat-containing protein [Promethearchaeota archaeon CR_4]|nr:MAG: NHL repeat-containing protein [Candidatus Lokiarchaeota archaeon CR_4]
MKPIQYTSLFFLAGILLVLAMAIHGMHQPIGTRGNNIREYVAPSPAASNVDYLYTLGVTGESGSDNNHFQFVWGLVVNATGHLYVADAGNNRVQVFDRVGTYQYTIGSGYGSDNAHFYGPSGVAVNTTGHLYVMDTDNQRVQVFDSTGTYLYTIGTPQVIGNDNDHFHTPLGVTVNNTGHVYIADTENNRVQVFDRAGNYQYTIGAGVQGSDNAHFYNPIGVAVNTTGYLFVADSGNHRVQVFDSAGVYQYTIGTSGVAGSDTAHFNSTMGVAVNAIGYIYVSEWGNHRVQVFDHAGTYQDTIGVTGEPGADNGHFNYTTGIAVNATGHLYVSDYYNYRVQVFGTRAPTALSIAINDGAEKTTNTSAILTLSAINATEMCFSNNGTTYTDWEAYSTSKLWEITFEPGEKTVYFKARYGLSEAAAVSDTITYLPPSEIPGYPLIIPFTIIGLSILFLRRYTRRIPRR